MDNDNTNEAIAAFRAASRKWRAAYVEADRLADAAAAARVAERDANQEMQLAQSNLLSAFRTEVSE